MIWFALSMNSAVVKQNPFRMVSGFRFIEPGITSVAKASLVPRYGVAEW